MRAMIHFFSHAVHESGFYQLSCKRAIGHRQNGKEAEATYRRPQRHAALIQVNLYEPEHLECMAKIPQAEVIRLG